MNSAPLSTPNDAATAQVAGQAAGAVPGEALGPDLGLSLALAAAQPGAPLPFLQFMQLDAALPGEPAQPELAADGAAADGAVPAAEALEEQREAGAQAEPLLAAMSLPLMPAMMPSMMPIAAALRPGAAAPEGQECAASAVPAADAAGDGALALPAALAARSAGAGEAPLQAAQPALEAGNARMARTGAASAQPAVAPPQLPAAAAPARDGANSDGQAANSSGSGGSGAGNQAGFGVAAPGAPLAAPRDGGTLALSGPPTAWRQNLQEALGERLQLQVGRNAERAVIRLEPPMLGRIEISIRHAAGSLEVNITATHSEVLRQLNTVSDSLRSDLAQRQYTDVSVNVSQSTPRAQAGAQAQQGAHSDAQGRGRQPGQDQDERAPGAALAEANQSTTAFSLSGRA